MHNFEGLLSELNESRGESGRGSKSGRDKGIHSDSKAKYNPKKAKVKVYPSISKALSNTKYGEIFSTDSANRLYVTTKPSWGKKSTAGGNNKSAKGFTPGSSTPGASWDSIKGYAVRTMKKHGGETAEKFKTYSKHKKNEAKKAVNIKRSRFEKEEFKRQLDREAIGTSEHTISVIYNSYLNGTLHEVSIGAMKTLRGMNSGNPSRMSNVSLGSRLRRFRSSKTRDRLSRVGAAISNPRSPIASFRQSRQDFKAKAKRMRGRDHARAVGDERLGNERGGTNYTSKLRGGQVFNDTPNREKAEVETLRNKTKNMELGPRAKKNVSKNISTDSGFDKEYAKLPSKPKSRGEFPGGIGSSQQDILKKSDTPNPQNTKTVRPSGSQLARRSSIRFANQSRLGKFNLSRFSSKNNKQEEESDK